MSKELEASARRWAWEYMLCNAELPEHAQDDEYRAAQHILATTTPPTMADVEWNDEKHYLAGAVDADGHEVVMLDKLHGNIRVCDVDQMGLGRPVLESPKTITPNGKRYELREVGAPEQPAHPATLETVEDYVNAPHGTIVAGPGVSAWTKGSDGGWWQGRSWFTSSGMAGTKRDMLRRGWRKRVVC